MTLRISSELREALKTSPDLAVRIYDPDAKAAYVVIPEAIYERLCAMSDEDWLNDSQYAHIAKLIGPNGLLLDDDETVV